MLMLNFMLSDGSSSTGELRYAILLVLKVSLEKLRPAHE